MVPFPPLPLDGFPGLDVPAQGRIGGVDLLQEPLPPKRLDGLLEEGLHGPPFALSHLPEDLASRVADAYGCVSHSVDSSVYRLAYHGCLRREHIELRLGPRPKATLITSRPTPIGNPENGVERFLAATGSFGQAMRSEREDEREWLREDRPQALAQDPEGGAFPHQLDPLMHHAGT